MRAGIIGSGMVGETLAKKLIASGNEVVLSNRRGIESLANHVSSLGKSASAGTVSEAAKQEIVFLAVPWSKVSEALDTLPNCAVVDGVGAATVQLSVSALRDGGKLVSYGVLSGPVSKDRIDIAANGKSVTLIEGQVGVYIEQIGGFSVAASDIFELILSGIFNDKMICTYPFEDIVKVHEMMENRQANGVISLLV